MKILLLFMFAFSILKSTEKNLSINSQILEFQFTEVEKEIYSIYYYDLESEYIIINDREKNELNIYK